MCRHAALAARQCGATARMVAPMQACIYVLMRTRRAAGRNGGALNANKLVLASDGDENTWRALDARVNKYPGQREFTAIGGCSCACPCARAPVRGRRSACARSPGRAQGGRGSGVSCVPPCATAGKGGDSFRDAMLSAVSSVVGSVHEECVSQRESRGGKWISVRIGPVWVTDGDQVGARALRLCVPQRAGSQRAVAQSCP